MASRKTTLRAVGSDVVYGALAGAVGAACMTPLRIAARRAGLIDKMVPQVIEEKLADKLGVSGWTRPEVHHVADQLLHFGFGSTLGAAYGAIAGRGRSRFVARGLVFGTLAWLLGGGVVVPLTAAARPIWRSRPRENLVNIGAHLVFGLVTALLTDELAEQSHHRRTSDLRRWLTPVG